MGCLLVVRRIRRGCRFAHEQKVLLRLRRSLLLIGSRMREETLLLEIALALEQLSLCRVRLLLEEEVVRPGAGGDQQLGARALSFHQQQLVMSGGGSCIQQQEVVLGRCGALAEKMGMRARRCRGKKMVRRTSCRLEKEMRMCGGGLGQKQMMRRTGGGFEQQVRVRSSGCG